MDQTDPSKRKPRKARGTPAYYHRNRFALGAIAVGTIIFAAFAAIPKLRRANEQLVVKFSRPSEQELDRRALFNLAVPRTSVDIAETIEEAKRFEAEK